MIGYDLFRIYLPIRLHFTSTYDVIKYGSNVKNMGREFFENRKDKYAFDKHAGKINSPKTAGQICLANFVYNDVGWLYHDHKEVIEIFYRWKGIVDEMQSVFIADVNKLVEIAKKQEISHNALFEKTLTGKLPPILQMLIHAKIHKESVVILSHFTQHLQKWIDQFDHDPLLSDQLFLLKKYTPFIINKENQRNYHEVAKLIF